MDDVAIKVLALELDAVLNLPRVPINPKTVDVAKRLCKAMPPCPPRVRETSDVRIVDAFSETMSRMGKKMSPWLRAAILNLFEEERELSAMGFELVD